MKLLPSLLLTASLVVGVPPDATPGEQETAHQKKLRDAFRRLAMKQEAKAIFVRSTKSKCR